MDELFDPYYKWLAIAPEDQPPDLYRLLGVRTFEDDPEVIQAAANQRMGHLKTYQSGKRSAESQRLLNEVAAAKIALLNPEKKEEYDRGLRTAQPASDPGTQGGREQVALALGGSPQSIAGSSWGYRPRKRRSKSPWLTQAGLLVLVVVAAGAAIAYHRGILPGDRAENDAVDQPGAAGPTSVTSEEPLAEASPVDATADTDGEADLADSLNAADSSPQSTAPLALGQRDESTNRSLADLLDDESGAGESNPPNAATYETQPSAMEPTAPESRRAVPSQTAQDEAKETIQQIFRGEISAARTSRARIELARRFVSYAQEMDKDPADRYTLLIFARDLAASAGNSQLSLQTVDQLASEYEVDALEMKIRAIQRAIGSAGNVQVLGRLIETSRELIDEAVQDSRYEIALDVVRTSLKQAQRMRSRGLASECSKLSNYVEARKASYEVIRRAKETLQSSPDDPDANLVVGEHLVITEGDWERALPHLAKGADDRLAGLANMELSDLSDSQAKIALAESWEKTALARHGTQEEPIYLRRAIHWFQESLPQLGGLDRIAATKKLERLEAAVELAAKTTAESLDESADATLPKFAERFIGKHVYLATGKKTRQTVSNIWDFRMDYQVTENDVPFGTWSVADGSSILVTPTIEDDSPFHIRPRSGSVNGARTAGGEVWRWKLTRLMHRRFEHRSEGIQHQGNTYFDGTEILTLYSNGRVNDPLGEATWSQQGNRILIDWGDSSRVGQGRGEKKMTEVTMTGNGYFGKTTQPIDQHPFTVRINVSGRLLSDEP